MKDSLKNRFLFPLDLVCASKGDPRTALQFIHFHNGYAYACNAMELVRVPMNMMAIDNANLLDGMQIHRNAFARIRRHKITAIKEDESKDRKDRMIYIHCGDYNLQMIFPCTYSYKMPDYDKVIKTAEEARVMSSITSMAPWLMLNSLKVISACNAPVEVKITKLTMMIRSIANPDLIAVIAKYMV